MGNAVLQQTPNPPIPNQAPSTRPVAKPALPILYRFTPNPSQGFKVLWLSHWLHLCPAKIRCRPFGRIKFNYVKCGQAWYGYATRKLRN
jgi:hypothetical protein